MSSTPVPSFSMPSSTWRNHPSTRLVSLMVGANDAFLCEDRQPGRVRPRNLPAVTGSRSFNVADIFVSGTGRGPVYHGTVYCRLLLPQLCERGRTMRPAWPGPVMDSAAKPFHVVMADEIRGV